MAVELPRPGVEVIQVFRSVSPTVVTPTLVPNVTGVCKQVVELLESDGAGGNSLNADALITLPAFFIAVAGSGDPALYTGLDGLALVLSINNGPLVTVTFVDALATGLSPATVVSQIMAAFDTAGVTAALAETLGDDQFVLRTVLVGEFASIYVDATTAAAVATAFGIGQMKTYTGIGLYNQYITEIPETSFPDPRGNLAELAIESDSVRVFIATGNGTDLQEAKRTQAFLRNGTVNDQASRRGSVDLTSLTYPGDVDGLTISIKVDGGATQLVTTSVGPGPADVAALIAELNAGTTGCTFSAQVTTNFLLITSDSEGAEASIEVIAGGTLLAVVGLTAGTNVGKSIEAIDDGNGDAVTPLLRFQNRSEDGVGTLTAINFLQSPTAAAIVGSAAMTLPLTADTTLIISDGHQQQTITFDGTETAAQVVTKINGVVGAAAGGFILASQGASVLTLTHTKTGTDSVIRIIGGTALANLDPGVTPTIVAGFTRGIPSMVEVGDELWIDGVFYGTVVAVHPGGTSGVLKVDKQVPMSLDIGRDFYLIAKNLPSATPSRPRPELVLNINGDVSIKQEMLRDVQGNRTLANGTIYLSYTAVRQDVTSTAEQPGLLRFDDTTQLEEALAPITTENPLALGLFFALLNAPGVQVTGLGVDAVSADAPFGTVEAFTRAAEYLEAFEVYAIAPLTHDQIVHQVFKTHVDVMSEPSNKGERIVLVNPTLPTRKLDTLIASGLDGDELSATTLDTKIANLSALVLNAGVSPVGTIPASAGLFLDIASDDKMYSISAISGSVVTIRTSFASGENDDGFFATTDFNASPLGTLISEAFSVKLRGAELLTVNGDPDNQGIAETIQRLGQAYLDRRVWMVVPDTCQAPINGLETILDGFYMCAAITGMIGQQPPQQSFTNFPMTGFTTVIGSNNKFNERQLNIMAGGGAYIIVQDAPGAPLISRFALTTDLTSIETRTDSITKVVDFTAKFMRSAIRNFIGRFNITQGFLDTLGSVTQGLIGFLIENGVLIGANVNNIIQDEDAPDTVLIDITLDVPYPCNFIRLTLVI